MELTKRSFCKGLVNDARELRNVWSRMRNEVTLSEEKPSRTPKVLIKDKAGGVAPDGFPQGTRASAPIRGAARCN